MLKGHQRDYYKYFTSLEIKEEIDIQAIDKMVRNPAALKSRSPTKQVKGKKKGQRKQGGDPRGLLRIKARLNSRTSHGDGLSSRFD